MLSTQLSDKFGSTFAVRNLRRMMQFAEQFEDFEIVSMASTQLTELYDRSFEARNLRRMLQYANQFSDENIFVTLSRHFKLVANYY